MIRGDYKKHVGKKLHLAGDHRYTYMSYHFSLIPSLLRYTTIDQLNVTHPKSTNQWSSL